LPFDAALCDEATTDGIDPGPAACALVQRTSQGHVGYTRRAAHKLFNFVGQIIHPARLAAAHRAEQTCAALALSARPAQKGPAAGASHGAGKR
jgi:hypothetical protein